jgi:hypothetical protein
LLLHASTQDG